MRSERLFEIVFILLNKKRTTAQELAKRFGVSVRTIYRDMDILSSAGIPVYTMQGTGGGIFIDESYTINKSILTKEEQEKILLALQCLSPIDEIHTESILNRLSAIFQKNADWVKVDYSRWDNKNNTSVFHTVKQAILECCALRIEYLSSYGEKTDRTIYPLRLLYKSRAWYVESFCAEKNDYRLFRLNRMLSVTQTVKTFKRADLLGKIPDDKKAAPPPLTNIKLKCSAKTAYRLYDEFPQELIAKNSDGSYTMNAALPFDSWVCGFILSLGTEVEILEPENLKTEIAKLAEEIMKNHRKV
ncbi:YafY family transcriptional regulator [Treponema denticola]|uniref:YafY family transcriptional regulator n=1 Tax=Treponema denticola TaxID=158 RepID=A0A9Q9EXZ8_TREDN|nr:YafY family protein [Treponema denticola]UTC89732.1 YafY family transcriptional regulator [Treponema denticola]UTD00917.1 YafY family transcriptional regulator [Treponema denticola]